MALPATDAGQAIAFLRHLFKPYSDGFVEIRPLSKVKPHANRTTYRLPHCLKGEEGQALTQHIMSLAMRGYDVYVGVCPRAAPEGRDPARDLNRCGCERAWWRGRGPASRKCGEDSIPRPARIVSLARALQPEVQQRAAAGDAAKSADRVEGHVAREGVHDGAGRHEADDGRGSRGVALRVGNVQQLVNGPAQRSGLRVLSPPKGRESSISVNRKPSR